MSLDKNKQKFAVVVRDFFRGVKRKRAFPAPEREELHQRGAAAGGRTGVGLGLAICRAIVALHGGRAWGEPMASGGSAFRFSLPVDTPPPPPPAESAAG